MNTADSLAQLAKEPMPYVEDDPGRVAMLQSMQRMGHIRAHVQVRDGHTRILVEALTPQARKIERCLQGAAPRRLTTAFWAFKVQESAPRGPAKFGDGASPHDRTTP